MGTKDSVGFHADGEGPVRKVSLKPFKISARTVTTADFSRFVKETGYRTEAEHFGWSFVFHGNLADETRKNGRVRPVPGVEWWLGVPGADWRHPFGPESNLSGLENHPVTHVSWNDAQAFCRWSGGRLPTEAEWEYAARGGLEGKRYPWGDELTPGGKHMCNIWQGEFPYRDSGDDGYTAPGPADAYEANGFGLYCVAGNVWEWCADRWSSDYHLKGTQTNPIGPPYGSRRVMRGGSYLCHASYCNRYRVAARSSNTPESATTNLGFRVAADID